MPQTRAATVERESVFQRQFELIAQLAASRVHIEQGFDAALREIGEATARALDVDRVGIWQVDLDNHEMVCLDIFDRPRGIHDHRDPLDLSGRQDYLQTLSREHMIAVDDTKDNPLVAEIERTQLRPFGIRAFLQAAIRRDDRMIGTMTASQIGRPRRWSQEEQVVFNIFVEFVSRTLEANERRRIESRMRDFASAASDWFWETDSFGRFTFLSKRFHEMTGDAPDDALGRTPFERGQVVEDPAMAREFAAAFQARRPYRGLQVSRVLADGSKHWIESSGVPVFDDAGDFQGYRGVSSDVTAQREAAEALRAGERRFQDFAEAASDWFWELDADLRFAYVSDRYFELTGFRREDVIGRVSAERAGTTGIDETSRSWRRFLDDLGAHRPVKDFEYAAEAADGETRVVRVSGVPIFAADGQFTGYRGVGTEVTERKRAEQALRDSEYNFRQLIENSLQGVSIIDTERRYFVNRAFAEMLGYESPDELMTTIGPFDTFPPERRAEYLERVADRLRHAGKPVPFEAEVLRKDGTKTYILAMGSRIEWYGRPAIMSTVIDMSERKRAEARLRAERDQLLRQIEGLTELAIRDVSQQGRATALRAITEMAAQAMPSARVGVWLYAPNGDEVVCADVYDSIEDRHESGRRIVRAPEKFAQEIAEKIVVVDDVETDPRVADFRDSVLRPSGIGAVLDISIWSGGDCLGWLSFSHVGGPRNWSVLDRSLAFALGGYCGRIIEADQRRKAEQNLRESERNFRAIAEGSPVPMVITRRSDGLILYANPKVGPTLGVADDPLVGRNIREFFWRPEQRPARAARLETHGFLPAEPLEMRRADGSRISTLHSLQRINFAGEDAFLGSFEDITERRRLEQQLRQAQKMEAVGQLTGGIAHDFNNLLAVIMGNLEMLVERQDIDGETAELAGRALKATRRGADLTHRLLTFSRKQPLQPMPVDANRLIDGMSDLLRRTLTESIDLSIDRNDRLWLCETDRGQLEGAILNLVINARDAMPSGGCLRIETGNITVAEATQGGDEQLAPGDYVVIAVRDTGVGMSDDVIAQAFDPFFTTKAIGKGTGLGLSMIYGFATQSGGQARIDSEPGRGSTVRLFLPRSAQSPSFVESLTVADGPAADGDEPKSDGRGETVLVVEDDSDLRAITVEVLERLGYRVLQAGGAHDALALIATAPTIALLLADVMLPGELNGPDVADRACEAIPGLRVLYMSGYTEDMFTRRSRLGTDVDLLEKPFGRAELARRVRAALDRPA